MKRFQVAILSILMLVLFSESVFARKISSLRTGNWRGGAYTNDRTGKFSHCAASVKYKSGIRLLFSVTRTLKWKMGLSKPSWNLRINNRYNIDYRIDGGRTYRGTAISTTKRLVQVPLPGGGRLFNQIKYGRKLTVWTAQERMLFTLSGTRKMLSRLLRCTKYYVKRERRNNYYQPKSSDPFSAPNRRRPAPAPRRQNNADPFEANLVLPLPEALKQQL